jgi:hypothetical protein
MARVHLQHSVKICANFSLREFRDNKTGDGEKMAHDFADDFTGCPTFFVTHARTEAFGQNVRIYHWEKRGSILAPQFVAVLPAPELMMISRDVREAVSRVLLCSEQDVGTSAH